MGFHEVGEAYLLSRNKNSSEEPWPRALDMAIACSKLMSLTERQPVSHGLELAVLAGSLSLPLLGSNRERRLLMQSALLHDMGMFHLLGRLSPEQEALLPGHAMLVTEDKAREIPGLERHLLFPTDLVRLLHLEPDIVRWVAYHHLFLNQKGLPPEVPTLERPNMGMNLLVFCDCLLAQISETRNLSIRFERVRAFLDQADPQRFYPEILEMFRSQFETPESLKLLDHRTLTRRFYDFYPEAESSPYLNGIEVLHLCRWLATQADARQPEYTLHEAASTADLMVAMGMELDLPMDALGQLALAGLLHDVGKLAIPLEVLRSDKTLTAREQEYVTRHAQLMEEIFVGIPGFETVGQWMGEHHECLNGSGYPYSKRGHELSVGARLLAIADSYVALTQPRPYRPMPYRPQDALDIMKKQQGRIFDASLLQILESTVAQRTG